MCKLLDEASLVPIVYCFDLSCRLLLLSKVNLDETCFEWKILEMIIFLYLIESYES